MKKALILFLTAAIFFGLDAAPVLGAQPSNVTIQYVSPDKFSDFRIHGRDARWSASYFADKISDDLKPALNRQFPGSKLTLRFTDIDLAGSYRTPSRGGRDVRVTGGLTTPVRMSFVFLLQDSSGRTLTSGSTRITDNSSQSSLARQRSASEPLYYEKKMLQRWLRSVKPS
jgi:Protein of unknown function (DUF3016)